MLTNTYPVSNSVTTHEQFPVYLSGTIAKDFLGYSDITDGYLLRFRSTSQSIMRIAAFVVDLRLRRPVITFMLFIGDSSMYLRLTGTPKDKDLLKQELGF